MPLTLTQLCLATLLPAAVAGGLTLVALRCLSERAAAASVAVAAAAGFHSGYWSQQLGKPIPSFHWEWLPWLIAGAVIPELIIVSRRGLGRILRWVLIVGLCCAGAWLLVPDFAKFAAIRTTLTVTLAVGLVLTSVALSRPTDAVAGRWLTGQLAFGGISLVVVLLQSGSLRFAQIGLCAFSPLAGLLVVSFRKAPLPVASLRTVVSFWFAGLMLTAYVQSFSDVPAVAYVICGAIPAAAGVVNGLLSHRTRIVRRIACGLPFVLVLVAAGLAVYADLASADESW